VYEALRASESPPQNQRAQRTGSGEAPEELADLTEYGFEASCRVCDLAKQEDTEPELEDDDEQ